MKNGMRSPSSSIKSSSPLMASSLIDLESSADKGIPFPLTSGGTTNWAQL